MTQQSVKWLITVPEGGPSFNERLTIACGGNERMGSLLYFFLGRGAYVVGQKGLKPDEIEYVRLSLSHDQIMEGLKSLQRSASKPSIVTWMRKLNQLGYVISDGYHQQYDIYFHKIAKGITNPPPREVALRGRHATKKKIQDLTLDSETSCSPDLNLSVDSKDLTLDYTNKIQDLTLEIQDLSLKVEDLTLENKDLRGEILNLKSQMLDFKSEILKVKSLISQESASDVPSEVESDAINNISINNGNLKSNTNTSVLDKPASVPTKSSSRKKPSTPSVQPPPPQEQVQPKPVLSERGQSVWGEWCNQPWFKRARPKLTETAIKHCNTLAESDPLPTAEEMVKARNWYQKKYKNRQGWYLGNFEEAYPQWLSENYKPVHPQSARATVSVASSMDEAQAQALAVKALAQAQAKGHEIQVVARGSTIVVNWQTEGFEKPEIFESEACWSQVFAEMCEIWDDLAKKKRRVS